MRPVVLLILFTALGWTAEPAVEFIQVTDTHVVDLAGVDPMLVAAREHFAGTGASFERFLGKMAGEPRPAFLLHTGDIADAYCFDRASGPPVCGGASRVKPILDRSPVPVFLALGNHDIQIYQHLAGNPKPAASYSVAPEARREWARTASCFREGASYYSFRQQVGRTSYVFLVLDVGERRLARDSAFSAAQLAWLRKQVAAEREAALILVMHVPLAGDEVSNEIKSAAESDRVVLSLAGHRHSDGIEEIGLGRHTITQVRTAAFGYGESNWRRIRLLEDRIEIAATGRPDEIARTISVPAGQAPCACPRGQPW